MTEKYRPFTLIKNYIYIWYQSEIYLYLLSEIHVIAGHDHEYTILATNRLLLFVI